MAGGKSAVVAGATGSVGRLVVSSCLTDPRIDKVTAVVRQKVPADRAGKLWGTTNTAKLSQVQVDYISLKVDNVTLKEAFKGTDAFLTCLGLYSGRSTEAESEILDFVHVISSLVYTSIVHHHSSSNIN